MSILEHKGFPLQKLVRTFNSGKQFSSLTAKYDQKFVIITGEIIAPKDKSRSVMDPKILKTFRTYFFTALSV